MWMLKFALVISILFSCCGYKNTDNHCKGGFQGKYQGKLIINSNEIVELSKLEFAQLIGEMKGLMSANVQLDSLQTIELIRVMNLLEFSKEDYVQNLKKEIKSLDDVERMFYSNYLQEIKCQNKFFDGKNGSLNFKLLGINYGGKFYHHCSLIYVDRVSGYGKTNFIKNIMNVEINENEEWIR
jgi:hypothetical protein